MLFFFARAQIAGQREVTAFAGQPERRVAAFIDRIRRTAGFDQYFSHLDLDIGNILKRIFFICIAGRKPEQGILIILANTFERHSAITQILEFVNQTRFRYFSTVAPDVVQGSEENLIDVIVNVEEQSTASIQFGVTFSGTTDADAFPLSVFVQWEDKNFLGNGQTVSANATVSPDTQSVSLGYSENYFMNSPLTVSFTLSVAHKTLYAYQDVEFPVFDDTYYDDYGMVPDRSPPSTSPPPRKRRPTA